MLWKNSKRNGSPSAPLKRCRGVGLEPVFSYDQGR